MIFLLQKPIKGLILKLLTDYIRHTKIDVFTSHYSQRSCQRQYLKYKL